MGPESEAGRYRLTERLEPESDTWLAEDLEDPTAHPVVKILPEGSDAIAARHLAELFGTEQHAEINQLTDCGELPDGRPFLVYPYVEGTSLRNFLNASGPLPLALAGQLLADMGRGLEALHGRRMVYGILSPEHVIVHQEHGRLQAKLLNAGSYRVTGSTSTSPGYLAPEQAAGNPVLASDVFSLGAVAAEMLTGRRVFRYGSLAELAKLQKIGVPRGALRKLRGKIPLRVEEEIRRALSWDPAHRPSDIALFGERMTEYLGAEGLFPKRRLIILGVGGLVLASLGYRRCRR